MRATHTTLVGVALALGSWSHGCQTATQVSLQLSTDVPGGSDTSAWVQTTDGRAESQAVTVSTIAGNWSDNGQLGSLTLVPPSGTTDARAGVRVTLGKGKSPEACLTAFDAQCIQASRRFRYQNGRAVTLPVGLYAACLGVRCPDDQTCNYSGKCVSNEIDTSRCGDQAGCILEGDPPSPPGVRGPSGDNPPMDSGADVAPPPAPVVRWADSDPRQGFVAGTLELSVPTPVNDGALRVFWTDQLGMRLEQLAAFPATTPARQVLLPGSKPPAGAVFLEAELTIAGKSSTAPRVLADNYLRTQDVGTDRGADALDNYTATIDDSAEKLLVFGTDLSGRIGLRRCELDGSQCKGRVLDPTGAIRFPGPLAAAFDPSTSQFVVFAPAAGRGPSFLRCSATGDGCTIFDAPATHAGGLAPALLRVVHQGVPRVVAATQRNRIVSGATLALSSCPVGSLTTGCTLDNLDLGSSSPFTYAAVDPASNVAHFVAGIGMQHVTCNPDVSGCTSRALRSQVCSSVACSTGSKGVAADFGFGARNLTVLVGTSLGIDAVECTMDGAISCAALATVFEAELASDRGSVQPLFVARTTKGLFAAFSGTEFAAFSDTEKEAAKGVSAYTCKGSGLQWACRESTAGALDSPAYVKPATGAELLRIGGAINPSLRPTAQRFVTLAGSFATSDLSSPSGEGPLGNLVLLGSRLALVRKANADLQVISEDPSSLARPSMFTCSPVGTNCAHRDVSAASGAEGQLSGGTPAAFRDQAGSSTLIVTRDLQALPTRRLALWSCKDDSPSCTHRVMRDLLTTGGNIAMQGAARVQGRIGVVLQSPTSLGVLSCNEQGESCNENPAALEAQQWTATGVVAGTDGRLLVAAIGPGAPGRTRVSACTLAPSIACVALADVGHFTAVTLLEQDAGAYLLLGSRPLDKALEVLRCAGSPLSCTRFARQVLPAAPANGTSAAAWDATHQALYVLVSSTNPAVPASFLRCTGANGGTCEVLAQPLGPSGAAPAVLIDTSRAQVTFAYRDGYQLGRPHLGWLQLY
jgi:hypothetical protein